MTPRAGRRRAALLSISTLALAATLVPAQASSAVRHRPNAVAAVERRRRPRRARLLPQPGQRPAARVADVRDRLARRPRRAQRGRPSLRLLRLRARPAEPGQTPTRPWRRASRTALVAALADLPPEFAGCRAGALAIVEAAYAEELAGVADGPAEDRGVAVGTAAARAVLATRADDGSDTPIIVDASGYEQGTEPGQWRFTPDRPFAFAPGWGAVRPFALRGDQARHVDRPYPLRSRAYARDLATVKRLGGDGITTPSARTPDQTQAARFWIESSPLQWNRIARSVAVDRHLDAWDSRPAVLVARHGARRRLRHLVRGEVREPVLAAGHGDPRGSDRRQPEDDRRPDVDPAGHHATHPRPRLGPRGAGWCRGGRARPGARHRPRLVPDLQPDPARGPAV